MKTPAKLFRKLGLASALLAAAFGCSETMPDQAAAEARGLAADARADVADANARVTAAVAHVKAAEADARVDALANRRTESSPRAKTRIPSGTVLRVFLIDAIDSDTSSAGDRFLASLAESVVVNGATLLSKGTKVRGRVINAQGSAKVKGRAFLHLDLTDIVQANNRMVAITTSSFEETADSTKTRDAGKKGAAIGAGTGVVHYDPETRLDFTLTSPADL